MSIQKRKQHYENQPVLMKVMYKQDAVLFFLLKSKWAEMEIASKVRNVLFYQSRKLEFKPLR